MKRLFAFILALTMLTALGVSAFADEAAFDPTLNVVTESGKITVTVKYSAALASSPSLTIPCKGWYGAAVTFEENAVASTFEAESVTFAVCAGGTYLITRLYPYAPPETTKPTPEPAENPFTDLTEAASCYKAVLWAVAGKIASGTGEGTFSPDAVCTRAQFVTFLWRAAGSPAPTGEGNPFADVAEDAYYRQAVLWASERGVAGGVSPTLFDPDGACTRGQAVTFLWRMAEKPAAAGKTDFTDLPQDAYYAEAAAWAVSAGVAEGVSETTFGPDSVVTRGQAMELIYLCLAK